MKVIFAFLLSFMILVAWHFFKTAKQKRNKVKLEEKRITQTDEEHPYAAVKVLPCSHACQPAMWVASKIFLVAEFPSLPMPSCNQQMRCQCKFKHYDDRRHHEDRRTGSIVLQDVYAGDEHRVKKKRGRRETD